MYQNYVIEPDISERIRIKTNYNRFYLHFLIVYFFLPSGPTIIFNIHSIVHKCISIISAFERWDVFLIWFRYCSMRQEHLLNFLILSGFYSIDLFNFCTGSLNHAVRASVHSTFCRQLWVKYQSLFMTGKILAAINIPNSQTAHRNSIILLLVELPFWVKW